MVGTGPTKRIVPRRICGGDEGKTIARLAIVIPAKMSLGQLTLEGFVSTNLSFEPRSGLSQLDSVEHLRGIER